MAPTVLEKNLETLEESLIDSAVKHKVSFQWNSPDIIPELSISEATNVD